MKSAGLPGVSLEGRLEGTELATSGIESSWSLPGGEVGEGRAGHEWLQVSLESPWRGGWRRQSWPRVASSFPGVSLEGRLEEMELATSGIEEVMGFGCVSVDFRMMLIFSVLKTGSSRRFLDFGYSSFEFRVAGF